MILDRGSDSEALQTVVGQPSSRASGQCLLGTERRGKLPGRARPAAVEMDGGGRFFNGGCRPGPAQSAYRDGGGSDDGRMTSFSEHGRVGTWGDGRGRGAGRAGLAGCACTARPRPQLAGAVHGEPDPCCTHCCRTGRQIAIHWSTVPCSIHHAVLDCADLCDTASCRGSSWVLGALAVRTTLNS